jgi:hypothetical protein
MNSGVPRQVMAAAVICRISPRSAVEGGKTFPSAIFVESPRSPIDKERGRQRQSDTERDPERGVLSTDADVSGGAIDKDVVAFDVPMNDLLAVKEL